jgi:CheY-like chemotaxis protein
LNGQTSLEKLKESYENNQRYQIIFTDFNMPVMDGIESTKKMREYLMKKR